MNRNNDKFYKTRNRINSRKKIIERENEFLKERIKDLETYLEAAQSDNKDLAEILKLQIAAMSNLATEKSWWGR